MPSVTTQPVETVTATSAVFLGTIDDPMYVTKCGFYWSKYTHSPGPSDNVIECSLLTDYWETNLTGLSSGDEVSFLAWAEDGIEGLLTGDVVTFRTLSVPMLQTVKPTVTGATTAGCGGTFIAGGGSSIASRFVVASEGTIPTRDTYDIKVSEAAGDGSPTDWTCSITGMTEGVLYGIRAGSQNASGLAYGDLYWFRAGVGVVNAAHALSRVRVNAGIGL